MSNLAKHNSYTVMGNLPVIPAADLLDKDSPANLRGDARVNGAFGNEVHGIGKQAGMFAFRDDSGTLSLVFALGDSATDKWSAADGATQYTPV